MSLHSPTVFSPASVTCFFSPNLGETPLTTYSRGCAINIDIGVTAAIWPARSMQTTLNGQSVAIEPVQYVIKSLAPEPVCVAFETPLPLGCGFGVSAACCLTAAFGIARRYDLMLSRAELGLLAHEAEVISRTGFGDVASQLCGGLVLRSCEQGPLDAKTLGDFTDRLYYHSFGEIRTSKILDDQKSLHCIAKAGDDAIQWLASYRGLPTIGEVMDRSVTFAEDARLLTSRVRDIITKVQRSGGRAMMIMLGQSILATHPSDFTGPWVPCQIDKEGTRYIP